MNDQRPTHCEHAGCGLPPTNLQIYPLRPIDNEWICSRHPEYQQYAKYPIVERKQTPGPHTVWDE